MKVKLARDFKIFLNARAGEQLMVEECLNLNKGKRTHITDNIQENYSLNN